jgi:LuxR family transcriptional regulator, maltose regulon positive regulatory protein
VVNAPVGYGKTTLLRLWCIERPEAVVWMTLDAADDDPVRLWTHLATGSSGPVGVLEVRR